jgi:hypothetical protein
MNRWLSKYGETLAIFGAVAAVGFLGGMGAFVAQWIWG